jgi:hypothetical protein
MPFFCPKKPKQGKYDGKLLTENAANGPNELYFGQSMIIKCEKGGAQKQRRKAKSANDSREPLSQQDGISIKQPKERRKLSRNKWGKFPEDISNGGMQDPLQPFARGQEVREAMEKYQEQDNNNRYQMYMHPNENLHQQPLQDGYRYYQQLQNRSSMTSASSSGLRSSHSGSCSQEVAPLPAKGVYNPLQQHAVERSGLIVELESSSVSPSPENTAIVFAELESDSRPLRRERASVVGGKECNFFKLHPTGRSNVTTELECNPLKQPKSPAERTTVVNKGKEPNLRGVARKDNNYISRLRVYEPPPEYFPISSLDLKYDIPFHCVLCTRPRTVSYRDTVDPTNRKELVVEEDISNNSTPSRISAKIRTGRPVSIVNANPKLTSVTCNGIAVSTTASRKVSDSTASASAPRSSINSMRTHHSKTSSWSSIPIEQTHPLKQHPLPPLHRTSSAPQPLISHSTPPPLPQIRPTTAIQKQYLPAPTTSLKQTNRRNSMRRRASDTASDVAVRASSFRRNIRNGLVGLLTGSSDAVQRRVVKKGGGRWPCIDSQYGSMETVGQTPNSTKEDSAIY